MKWFPNASRTIWNGFPFSICTFICQFYKKLVQHHPGHQHQYYGIYKAYLNCILLLCLWGEAKVSGIKNLGAQRGCFWWKFVFCLGDPPGGTRKGYAMAKINCAGKNSRGLWSFDFEKRRKITREKLVANVYLVRLYVVGFITVVDKILTIWYLWLSTS